MNDSKNSYLQRRKIKRQQVEQLFIQTWAVTPSNPPTTVRVGEDFWTSLWFFYVYEEETGERDAPPPCCSSLPEPSSTLLLVSLRSEEGGRETEREGGRGGRKKEVKSEKEERWVWVEQSIHNKHHLPAFFVLLGTMFSISYSIRGNLGSGSGATFSVR